MAETKQAATTPVLYRRVYVDIPVESDALLSDKAKEMKVSKKALMERLVLEFVNTQPKPKKGKK